MKKTTLFILLLAQFFIGEIKTGTVIVNTPKTLDMVISSPIAVFTRGPIVDFCCQNSKIIGLVLAAYCLIMGTHFALDRVDRIYENKDVYNALCAKITSGDATLHDLVTFLRIYTLFGSKADVLNRKTTTVQPDGSIVEIHDKYVRRSGTGWPAWFKFKVLDHLEEFTNPLFSFCGVLWIINNALKDGTLPGNK